jgi:DNA replication and repair protein RecF
MLSSLLVRDFRCFSEAAVDLHPQNTLLIGRNAVGKTSLLEAACVLLRLQSPRTSLRAEMIRVEAKTAMIQGVWQGQTLRHAFNSTGRKLAVDGAVCGRGEEYLAQSGVLVWMDHSDMNLLRGGAEHRRRFMDFAASQLSADYLQALRGYEKALRSRNFVLKRDVVIPWRQVDAYAQVMDGYHRVLTQQRQSLLDALPEPAAAMLTELSCGAERLALHYQPSCTQESLLEELLRLRPQEERLRSTAVGAHRDDFSIQLNGRDAQVFASEGQQRSLSLALKSAQAQVISAARGIPPVLLLDDVFGELDTTRRRALLQALPAASQKIITTTHIDWAGELSGDFSVVQLESLAQEHPAHD